MFQKKYLKYFLDCVFNNIYSQRLDMKFYQKKRLRHETFMTIVNDINNHLI